MKRILLVITVLAFLPFAGFSQQDIHFSQFNASPLHINPSTAGLFPGGYRIANNYRVQWQSVSEAFTTIGAAVDFPFITEVFEDDHFGLGFSFVNDVTGDSKMTTNQGNLTVSYGKALDRKQAHFFSVGLQAGYAQRSIDYGELFWDKQFNVVGFNTALPSGEDLTKETVEYFDMAGGLTYFYSNHKNFKANFGIGMFHLTKPDIAFRGLQGQEDIFYRYVYHGGIEAGNWDNVIVWNPNFMYVRQGPNRITMIGTDIKFLLKSATKFTGYIKESSLALGGYYRHRDAIVATSTLNLGGLSIGLSYDFNVSGLSNASSGLGGPEFMLRYIGGYKKGLKTKHKNDRFF